MSQSLLWGSFFVSFIMWVSLFLWDRFTLWVSLSCEADSFNMAASFREKPHILRQPNHLDLYFYISVKTVRLFLDIYFGPSLNDRTLILLEEMCAWKQCKCSMFYFWCGPDSSFRILHLDRPTFLGAKIRMIVVPALEIYCGSSFKDTILILCRKVRIQSI